VSTRSLCGHIAGAHINHSGVSDDTSPIRCTEHRTSPLRTPATRLLITLCYWRRTGAA
jgi:hypothetical protein